MQLDFIERTSSVMSNFVLILVFIFIGFGLFLFMGFGIAEFFSYLWDNRIWGYFSAAFLFLVFGIILFAFRKKILNKLSDKFVTVMTEKRDDDDDNEDDEKPKS